MDTLRHKQILIVEDEEGLARTVKARLETIGYEVQVETEGKPGIRYAAEHRVDLVILDVNLPDINGYEVARELRKLYHPWTLPILMLTVKDKPVDQLRGFAHGADAYITKPFDSAELFQTVALLTGEAATVSGQEGSSADSL
ncbi:MAG: response regulator [Candidatus Omnitrophica bacterium]|nr:response regulator [Candidatus Omnitrophota bacterium]